MATFTESPGSNLDYTFNWINWLATGETISSATISAPDLTAGAPTVGTTAVTVFLAGLVLGMTYQVKCTIATSSGRTDSRVVSILCEQRTN